MVRLTLYREKINPHVVDEIYECYDLGPLRARVDCSIHIPVFLALKWIGFRGLIFETKRRMLRA